VTKRGASKTECHTGCIVALCEPCTTSACQLDGQFGDVLLDSLGKCKKLKANFGVLPLKCPSRELLSLSPSSILPPPFLSTSPLLTEASGISSRAALLLIFSFPVFVGNLCAQVSKTAPNGAAKCIFLCFNTPSSAYNHLIFLPSTSNCFLNWHLQLFLVAVDVFIHHLYLYLFLFLSPCHALSCCSLRRLLFSTFLYLIFLCVYVCLKETHKLYAFIKQSAWAFIFILLSPFNRNLFLGSCELFKCQQVAATVANGYETAKYLMTIRK